MPAMNSTRAAELIRAQTGRPCSRQNLEKHVRRGTLPRSTLQLEPIRLDSETVVHEFVANTDPAQAWAIAQR